MSFETRENFDFNTNIPCKYFKVLSEQAFHEARANRRIAERHRKKANFLNEKLYTCMCQLFAIASEGDAEFQLEGEGSRAAITSWHGRYYDAFHALKACSKELSNAADADPETLQNQEYWKKQVVFWQQGGGEAQTDHDRNLNILLASEMACITDPDISRKDFSASVRNLIGIGGIRDLSTKKPETVFAEKDLWPPALVDKVVQSIQIGALKTGSLPGESKTAIDEQPTPKGYQAR